MALRVLCKWEGEHFGRVEAARTKTGLRIKITSPKKKNPSHMSVLSGWTSVAYQGVSSHNQISLAWSSQQVHIFILLGCILAATVLNFFVSIKRVGYDTINVECYCCRVDFLLKRVTVYLFYTRVDSWETLSCTKMTSLFSAARTNHYMSLNIMANK